MNVKALYRKVRRKIQNQLSKMKKRGFDTSEIKLPSIPKKITEGSIRRLEKQFSTPKLYEKATYTIPETGEVVTGRKGRNYERIQAAKKASATRKKYRRQEPITPPPDIEPDYTPAPTVSVDDMYDVMVSKVETLIEEMYPCQIPAYAPPCAKAANDDFHNWLNGKSKEEVVAALEEWDMLEISQRFFDSDDANLYCHQRIVAKHLAKISETVKADLPRIEDDGDEFIEIDNDEMYETMFMQ